MNLALDWRTADAVDAHRLEARGVHLHYGARRVLQDVSLRAHPGRVLALVGPNGAGKSSLLAVLAGLQRPSLGEAWLDGVSLGQWSMPALARRRAMLSQKLRLDFAYRVEEVVRLGRSACGTDAGAAPRIVDAALQAGGVAHLRGRSYLELSGGEQQRVQLARVLAQVWDCRSAPGWLLLDEPEAAHQHALLQQARALAARGFGVIAVLHELNLAARYADDVALLAQGRLVRHGNVEEVLDAAVLSRVYAIALARTRTADGCWLIHPR